MQEASSSTTSSKGLNVVALHQEFYSPTGNERVGFILEDGSIVEVENVSANPAEDFSVSADDLLKYAERAIASFHTHPGESSQLSGKDYIAFSNWPRLKHLIIGNDGVTCYSVCSNGAVVIDEAPDLLSRQVEGNLS